MSSKSKASIQPRQVLEEYRRGTDYKRQLGSRGMYEQNRMNEEEAAERMEKLK